MLLLQTVLLQLVEAIDGPQLDGRNRDLESPLVEVEQARPATSTWLPASEAQGRRTGRGRRTRRPAERLGGSRPGAGAEGLSSV